MVKAREEERRPVAAAVLGLSTRLHEDAKGAAAKAFRRGAETDQLGIHYRGRSLSVGQGAGDRAMDGTVRTVDGEARLFDLFRGPHSWPGSRRPSARRGLTRYMQKVIVPGSHS